MNNDTANILLVDDNPMNLDALGRRLDRMGHQVIYANDGQEALDLLANHSIDIIVLDIIMPGMDGYETLERIKADPAISHIPVIMLSAIDDMDSIVRCIENGADDYLTKPFNKTLLQARITACLYKKRLIDTEIMRKRQLEDFNDQLLKKVAKQVKMITASHLAAIFSMSKLAESKDPDTGAHLERLREYCRLLAKKLQTGSEYREQISDEFIDTIYASSPLHDIGKVGVPDNILLKPDKLTSEEFDVMKTHCQIGADALRAVDRHHPGNGFIRMGIEIAESHHEKWDGSGYPHGIKGEEIPLSARILTLADVYDALTSERCYKNAFSHEESIVIIQEGRGTLFDPVIVDCFMEIEQDFLYIRKTYRDDEDDKPYSVRLQSVS